jgi:hypothetical protein
MKMLAYGGSTDFFDHVIWMGESTILKCFKEFSMTVIWVYATEYLRPPNVEEGNEILASNAVRGFPGMLGSIDSMHRKWGNCPTSWVGMYRGHKGKWSIILKAVATKVLEYDIYTLGCPDHRMILMCCSV